MLATAPVQRGRGKNRRRHRQSVRNQIFDQCDRQGPARHRPRRSSAQILIDRGSVGADGIQGLRDNRAVAFRPCPRDEVHQLAPPYGGVMPVARGLAQYRQQTIVETHL